MANHRLYGFWGGLTEGLRTGRPQNETAAGHLRSSRRVYADPARLEEFLAAMTGLSHAANMTIAATFPWRDYASFVDVGTAQGDLAVQIALANPHLTGTGFDLPEVGPIFEDYVAANGLAGRVAFAPATSSRRPCRRPTSSRWATSSTTGTSTRSECSSARPTTLFRTAAR